MSYHSNSSSTGGTTSGSSTTNTSGSTTTNTSGSNAITNTTSTVTQDTASTTSIETANIEPEAEPSYSPKYIEYDLIGINIDSSGIFQDYTFSDGQGSLKNDPSIDINIGDILVITNLTGGHPIEIKETLSGIVVASETEDSNIIEFIPDSSGLSLYTYYCKTHPSTMNGVINVYDPAGHTSQEKTSFSILPRYSGTGSIGNESFSWAEGSFDLLNVKNFSLSNDFNITGSGFFSNLVSDHVYVNSSIESSAGSNLLMGESNPTNANAGNLLPYGDNSQNLHVTFDGRFFAHNIYGDVSIKEPGAPWKPLPTDSLFSSSFSCTTRIISTKLTSGNPRLFAQIASTSDQGAIARFSDDYGQTWHTSTPEPASFFHGGPQKTTQAGWSNDIETHDNLLHVYGSSFDIGRSTQSTNYTLEINGVNNAFIFTFEDGSSSETPSISNISVYDALYFNNSSYNDYPLEILDPNGDFVGETDTNGITKFQPTIVGSYTYRTATAGVGSGTIIVGEASYPVVTYDQLYSDVADGDGDVYASNTSEVLNNYHAWSQLCVSDNIWDPTDENILSFNFTAEECKNFEFITDNGWIGLNESTDSFGWASGGTANFQYPNLVCDSKNDLIFGSQNTFPETNTLYTFFKGANKLLNHKRENGGTIDPAWVASQPTGSFIAYLTSHHALCDTNYRFEPGISDDHLIYIGHHFVPTSLFDNDPASISEIYNANNFNTAGSKSFNCKDFEFYGFDFGDLRDFKYVNDSSWSCVNIKTGEIYLLNTALAASALVLEELDGSDWLSYKRATFLSAFEKYKNKVLINGVETELSPGEEANKNAFGVNQIDYYLHDHYSGNIVGIGNNGWASLRNLTLEKYSTLSDVWENTTSNGFSPPSFSSFTAYHSASNTLTCGFTGVLSYSLESVSALLDNTWESGRFSNQTSDYLRDFRYDDSLTKFFSFYNSGSNGLHSISNYGWDAQTNQSLCNEYSVSRNQAKDKLPADHYVSGPKGYAKSLPGHQLAVPSEAGQGAFQNFMRMPDESVIYTTHGTTNSSAQNIDAWSGHSHLNIYRFEDDTFSNLLQTRTISYDGYSNGHIYSYGHSSFTANDNLTTNLFRSDFKSHPYQIKIDLFPGIIDIENLPQNSEEVWFNSSSVSRNFGVFYLGENCNAVFSDYSGMNPQDGRWSFLLEIKNLSTKNNFISPNSIIYSEASDSSKFSLSFTFPDLSSYSKISDYLSAIGLSSSDIESCTTLIDEDFNIRELELWVSVVQINSSGDYAQQYKKMIRLRDGSPSNWPDEPLSWENKSHIKSKGNLGFMFGEDISKCSSFQMPNSDLIFTYGSDWYVCPVNSFVNNGDYLDSEDFFNSVTDAALGPINTTAIGSGPNKGQASYPDKVICSINANSVLVRMKHGTQYYLGYLETDGNGGLIRVREVLAPDGLSTSNLNVRCFSSNNTTYFISEGRVWYTDSDDISFNAATTSQVTPNWAEIEPTSTSLQSVYGVGYHAGSELFYLLSDNGLYAQSYSGVNNWGIDFRPQYSFATQNKTGLYKDLSHDLHLVRDGEIMLTANKSGVSCNLLNIKDVQTELLDTTNNLYSNNGDLFWSGDLISSGSKIISNENIPIDIDADIDVEPSRNILVIMHYNGYIDQLNTSTFGEFSANLTGELFTNTFINIDSANLNNIFYINPSVSFLLEGTESTSTTLTVSCNTSNLLSSDGNFKLTAYYI